jgi:outer membrane protein OmpA-like peptidoglycan-associated protein
MDDLQQLATLLIAPEKKRLDRIENRLNDVHRRSQELATLLPAVLHILSEEEEFLSTLQMPVESCVKDSIQQNPQSFVKALLPAFEPLLRQAITEAINPINATLQTQHTLLKELNQLLQSLEREQTNQKKRLAKIDDNFQRFQRENVRQFTQLQSALQQLEQTEIVSLDTALKQLENTQINQYSQLNQVETWLKTFELAQTKQDTQIAQLIKVFNSFKPIVVNQKNQLRQLGTHVEKFEDTQKTQLDKVNQHLQNLDNVYVNQQTQVNQVNAQIEQIETKHISELQNRADTFEQVATSFHELAQRFNPQQRIQEIAAILPDAVHHAAFQSPEDAPLTHSLQVPVEVCIRQSVKKDVRPFADALFPLIGPMIRKSIGSTFKELLQRINTSLEQSVLSSKGMVWRMQAWRTGQPFSEIVLTNTLAYRVEQVFFIHRETGLLISHTHLEEIDVGDSDAVSAMFTAIQDFIRDSFSESKEEELDSVEIGNYNVWIERGPYAVLACVIRGDAPVAFRNFMRNLIEQLHARFGFVLQEFSGDNTSLQSCQPLLEETLLTEKKAEEEEKSRWLTPQLALILGTLFLLISTGGYFYFEYHYRLNNYLDTLHNTPGIIVAFTESEDGRLVIHGMRDPLAEEPLDIARRFDLTEEDIVFKGRSYQDLEAQFVEQRLRQWLKPPKTVQISLQNGSLHLTGHADQAWIDKVNSSVGMMTGFSEIVAEKLVNTEEQFQAFLKRLNETAGIIVVSSSTKDGQQLITGMRDPLAEDPVQLAEQMQITDVDMRWTHYQDLNPQFVEKRVRQRLALPSTVQIRLEGEVLYFSGHAPQAWIDKAMNTANTVSGIHQLDTQSLLDTDSFLLAEAKRELNPSNNINLMVKEKWLTVTGHVDSATFNALQSQLRNLKNSQPEFAGIDTSELINAELEIYTLTQRIEKTAIYFSDGTGFMPNQETMLQNLLAEIQQLLAFSQELNQPVQLQVIGDTDGLGTQFYNQQLGQKRAQLVVDWLQKQGLEKKYLVITPPPQIRFGESEPNPGYRNVSFRVIEKE